MLGAKALLGRLLLPDEDKPGKPVVAILTYGAATAIQLRSARRGHEHYAEWQAGSDAY